VARDRGGERLGVTLPLDLLDLLGPQPKPLLGPGRELGGHVVAGGVGGHEQPLAAMGGPAAGEVVVAIPLLRLAAVDHPVVKQVEVPGTLPDLRVHDDRAVEAGHLVGARRARHRGELVVAGHHVVPPGVLEVALQGHAERAVVPEAVQAPVDLARLEDESAPLGERHDLVHP
jgi:hypothetical protein